MNQAVSQLTDVQASHSAPNPNTPALALDLVYRWEENFPDKLFMTQPVGGGEVVTYTWKEMMAEVRRMAAYLRSLELPAESHIALLSKNCAQWIMADLAIWMAGHVSVPLYPTLNAETVAYILEHSEARLIFVGKLDDWDTMKAGVPEDLPGLALDLAPEDALVKYPSWHATVASHQPIEGTVSRDPDGLATIVYTSGSTGKPKGVMLTFATMSLASKGVTEALAIHDDDRMLSYLPLSHVFERFVVEMGALRAGFALYFAETLDTFVDDLNRAKPTLFMAVPRIWTKFQSGIFAKLPPKKLGVLLRIPLLNRIIKKKVLRTLGLEHVRYAGSGSAPLSADILGWYRQLGLELLEGYGMSENFAYSHMSQPGRSRLGYVGEPLPGVQCRIAEDGEIQVKSVTNMRGYFKEDEKTAETFTQDGYLRTGDRGEIDAQGRLKITGRTKEIFKTSKGKYVAPAPIENRLINHPHIEMVCVAGANQPQPHAMVMLSDDAQAKRGDATFREKLDTSIASLIKEVNAQLDPHEHLSFVAIIDTPWTIENGFLTPTLKLKRNVVEEAYGEQLDAWYGARKKVIFL